MNVKMWRWFYVMLQTLSPNNCVHFFTHFRAHTDFFFHSTRSDRKQIINESIIENATDLSLWESIIKLYRIEIALNWNANGVCCVYATVATARQMKSIRIRIRMLCWKHKKLLSNWSARWFVCTVKLTAVFDKLAARAQHNAIPRWNNRNGKQWAAGKRKVYLKRCK